MDQPDFFVTGLNALSVEGSGLTRAAIVPPGARSEGFNAAYDWTTLWYDALRRADGIVLVCPKLLNLGTLIADGALAIDGAPARILRIERWRRHDLVRLAPQTGDHIATRVGRWTGASGISPDQADHFAGLNASLHISRNNRLDWIADWARFHIGEHGLEAMLVMDNGSDAYDPRAILDALIATGLKRAVVLNVPQPYGPVRTKKGGGGAKFLQPAMLNLARLRFLHRARAVLNVDLDELVWSTGGSVFDAAAASPFGLVSLNGAWRMPSLEADTPYRHADHLYLRPGDKPCPTKYCIAPGGWRRSIGWDVHKPESRFPFAMLTRRDFGSWHCRGITTNWKSYDRLGFGRVGPEDAFTAAKLSERLPRD